MVFDSPGKCIGLGIAFVIGLIVFKIADIYFMSWWTGQAPSSFVSMP
jgi:hypothetical protein